MAVYVLTGTKTEGSTFGTDTDSNHQNTRHNNNNNHSIHIPCFGHVTTLVKRKQHHKMIAAIFFVVVKQFK